MRKSARASLLVIVSLIGAIGLTIGAAFSAALAFGAVALIVPGTGTPNPGNVENYMSQAQKRYLQDTACADAASCSLQGIDYPASFWPLAIIPNWCRSGPDGCDKWDESVGKGTAALTSQLNTVLTTTNEQVVVFGYSQGGAVVSNVLSGYIDNLSQEQKDRIKVVTIGGIQTPDGGLWQRLGFFGYIPILDDTLQPPMNPNTGVDFISYAFHFDPVADAPRYWGNPFALLNAFAALETVHGYYLTPNGNGPDETLPYGYTDTTLATQLNCSASPENCREDANGNQYIVIPATSLPIADLAYELTPSALRPLIKPFLELVAPAYRVLAELGYDYTGDPSVGTPLSILPFNPFTFNPVNFAVQFASAIVQGITNALGGGTSLSPLNPPTTSPAPTVAPAIQALSRLAGDQTPVATLAAATAGTEKAAGAAEVAKPVSSEPTVAQSESVVDATPAVRAEPVVKEPATAAPVETLPATTEPVQTAPVTSDPTTTEPVKTEPVQAKPVEAPPSTTEPVTESTKAEPTKTEPAATEPAKVEPIKPTTSTVTKEDPADTANKVEPKKVDVGGAKDSDTKDSDAKNGGDAGGSAGEAKAAA